jgi:redox-regulated HSP33 family molecular chaperone
MSTPTQAGSYDEGTYKCQCGSRLFMDVMRIETNGNQALIVDITWVKCAFCGAMYGFDRGRGWQLWADGDGVRRFRDAAGG